MECFKKHTRLPCFPKFVYYKKRVKELLGKSSSLPVIKIYYYINIWWQPGIKYHEKVLFNIPLGVNKNHLLFPYKENEESKMNAFRNLGENPS